MTWWQFLITGGLGDVAVVALSIRFVIIPWLDRFFAVRIERRFALEDRLWRAF